MGGGDWVSMLRAASAKQGNSCRRGRSFCGREPRCKGELRSSQEIGPRAIARRPARRRSRVRSATIGYLRPRLDSAAPATSQLRRRAGRSLVVSMLESPVTRRLRSRRPAAFLSWMALGALGTYVDKIHEHFGVVAYPNAEWIGNRLPVSPAYVIAGLGFFFLYTAVVGHRGAVQGVFGGPPLRAVDIA